MAETTKDRSCARLMKGYWVFHAPVDYKYVRSKTEGGVLVRYEPMASIVAEALEGYASGRFATQTEVKRFLESQPEFPKQTSDGKIRLQKVSDMLSQPLYAGYLESKIWDVPFRKALHEPLISLEAFERIRKRRKSVALAPARKDIHADFPLRGFVTCADCDKPLRSNWSKSCTGKRYAYYLCHTKGCPSYGKSIRRADMEGEFATLLEGMRPSDSLFVIIKAMISDAWNQRAEQAKDLRKALRREVIKLERQIDGFLDRLVETTSPNTIKAYERKIDQLERQKLLAPEKLENSVKPRASADQMLELAMRFFANPSKLWESGDLTLQKWF